MVEPNGGFECHTIRQEEFEYVMGIDLGTTFSTVGVFCENGV